MKISLSIADLPLNLTTEELFHLASKTGFDGVEMLPGIKTIPFLKKSSTLSEKYNLPILSIHKPFWIFNTLFPTGKIFSIAKKFQALLVVHPLQKYSMSSKEQVRFLKYLAKHSEKNGVQVAIENLPKSSTIPLYKLFSQANSSTTRIADIYEVCKKYELGITLDTSHLETTSLVNMKELQIAFNLIKNIHISDFNKKKQHLALGSGELMTSEFLSFLKKRKYKGLITLELSPRIYCSKEKYFSEIASSFKIIKKFTS